MALDKGYLLVLFLIGAVSKGLAKTTFGNEFSLVLLLSVGLYYWRAKKREDSIYDDIAHTQAQAAAKLDALRGIGDGSIPEVLLSRRTHFQLRPSEASIITDRMHQHSRKLGGSRADRQKFLLKNRRRPKNLDDAEDINVRPHFPNTPTPVINEEEGVADRKQEITTVEKAIDATL